MAVTKAYILSDGEIVKSDYLDRFAIKQESRKIPFDKFKDSYDQYGLVRPIYNLEMLAQLLEINTYHYRAVKTKARDTVGLGWYLEPKNGLKEPDQSQKEKAMAFLEDPNPDKSLITLLNNVMVDYEATGNGCLEVIRDGDEIIGLEHIPFHTIRIHMDMNRYCQIRGDQRVWFKRFGLEQDVHFKTGEYHPLGSLPQEERANEIIHLRNYSSRSDFYGMPDILPALGAILADKERAEYNISFFENHAIPAYVVTVTGADLDDETEQMIKKYFQEDVKNSKHSTLVITAKKGDDDVSGDPIEIKFQALSTETKEASFRMFRQDNRDEILSAHGVPPYRAGITVEGQLGGSTAKESTEIYKQSVVKPRQEMIENVINRYILKAGLQVTDWKFRLREIDTKERTAEVQTLKTLFDLGAYSPNMILEKLGEERIDDPNMDRHFIYGKPLNPSEEETSAILNSLKEFHQKLLEIATKEKMENEGKN